MALFGQARTSIEAAEKQLADDRTTTVMTKMPHLALAAWGTVMSRREPNPGSQRAEPPLHSPSSPNPCK